MRKEIYIAVGNHSSLAGINEIIYSLGSCLSDDFSVKLTTTLRPNKVNIVIDEFAAYFNVAALQKTKQFYPSTKIVIVGTEFATAVRIFGVELQKTFNFFGTRRFRALAADFIGPLFRGKPSYMRLRYLGFVRALKYCDLVTVIHPQISGGLSKLLDQSEAQPLVFYPQIGPLSYVQLDRLATLPVGFTMTGTVTRYRKRIIRNLTRTFIRMGWAGPVQSLLPFDKSSAKILPPNDRDLGNAATPSTYVLGQYELFSPDLLYNLNPPRGASWAYSSPMRILRAILLGQIPVVTKRFHDHPVEDVAMLWDKRIETAIELGMQKFANRRELLSDYMHSIESYDRKARLANNQFISAMTALANSVPTAAAAPTTAAPRKLDERIGSRS